MDEVVKEFLVESSEALDQLDLDFIALENEPTNTDTIASVFRAIHTIKGTCGFLGFNKLESLTHAGETLLGQLRDQTQMVDAEITTALLALSDAVRGMLADIEALGEEGQSDHRDLVATLNKLQLRGESSESEAPAENNAQAEAASVEDEDASVESDQAEEAPEAQPEVANAKPEATKESAAPQQAGADAKPGVADTSVRVDVGLLDSLMNQVGELVLARNQILQYSSYQEDSVFLATSQRLNLITTELQEGVMKTRMQPIGTIWNKLPRVVRDLSCACGKQVRVEMDGEETELDRTIIEAIKDPLTHVVRNAVDHGIETPEDREANGKPAEGCVWLRAFHEGGQVNIEITDDGRGIDVERVKEKAIQASLISHAQASRMNDREALNLIFSPGLSTAAKVTNISGRGVGMDVVKTNIERIGGAVDLQTEMGKGSTLRIKIPLTLAIIPALIVTSGGDNYAIPQVSLLELVRLDGEQADKAIERIHDVPVYRLRGSLLPMVWLNEQLELESEKSESKILNIAVLQADDRQFGMVVDEVNDNQEIVVKPLGKLVKGLTCFAGATIMGDGRVALILDALGIAQRAGVVSESREVFAEANDESDEASQSSDEKTLLVFSSSDGDRMAVPLSKVARLEEFDPSMLERAGDMLVVQYRNEILPLVRLSQVMGTGSGLRDDEPLQVIVYSGSGNSVGIVVDRILDIVQQRLEIGKQVTRAGLLGTAVVQGRVTEIVDIDRVVQLAGIETHAV